MSTEPERLPPEAGKLPAGRIARAARVGGLVTGQGLRWAGMRTANHLRSPERAITAQNERTAALVGELVEQLGQMRGAAMKVGQVLSLVEFEPLVEDELALRLMRHATRWYAVPELRRLSGEQDRRGRDREPVDAERRAEVRGQISRFTLPAETALIRRMHAIVVGTLAQLRAGADRGAIAAEYLHGEPPATPLGEAETEYFARRGRS